MATLSLPTVGSEVLSSSAMQAELASEFVSGLVLEPEQVLVRSVSSLQSAGSSVELWVVPYASTTFIPALTAQVKGSEGALNCL